MGFREVWVAIRGKEDVSAAANKAGTSLKSLGNQAKSLLENQLVQGIGLAGMVAGLGKAVDAANELDASTRKLDATAKITGVSINTLQQISARGQNEFKLSATLANDFAVELAKLASKAGDVGLAAPGMAAFLDIGAARGLGAADTLKAVQQAILGIDEGTDKLFGKNPSVIYKEFSDQIGISAGKLTDQQKAFALMTAAMTDGEKVRGEYLRYLQTSAGQQELLKQEVTASAAELGKALQPALLAILPALTTLANGLSAFVGGIQLLAVDAAYFFEQIPNTVTLIKGKTLEQLGLLLKGAGDFIPFFGRKVSALGDSLIAEGQRQVKQSETYTAILLQVKEEAENEIVGVVKRSGAAQVDETKKTGSTITKLSKDELDKRAKAEEKAAKDLKDAREKWNRETTQQLEALGKWLGKETKRQGEEAAESAAFLAGQLKVNLGEASAKGVRLTTAAMAELLEQLRGKIPIEQWQALNAALQQQKANIADLTLPTENLADAAEDAADANKKIADEQERQQKQTDKLVRDAATLARAFVDAASATGLMDERMANVLNSAISLAASLPGAFAGDPASIAAAVSSLANIIVGVGSSETERRREANRAANTQALERLTREVGNLNLRESGKTFAGVQNAVDASIQARADARASGKGPGDADKAAKEAFLKSLRGQGIGLEEARALFKEMFGRDLSMANAGTFFQDIQAFSEGLANTEFGQFGSDFSSQLDALTKGFEIFGTDDADNKLAEFRDLVGRFSPALAKALDVDLASPEGRAQATKNLQALFQKLKTGGLSPEEIGVSGNEFLSLLSSILPLLADANGVLSSGLPASGPQTTGTTGPTTTPGLPNTSTFGIPLPEISGTVVQAPNTTTTINGGVSVTVNLPNVTDSREAAELVAAQVADILGADYVRQRTAMGLAS